MAVNSFMIYMNIFIIVQPCTDPPADGTGKYTAQRPDFFEPLILSGKPAGLSVKFTKFRFIELLFSALFTCVVFKHGGKPCDSLLFHFESIFGWTPFSEAVSLRGLSPLNISRTSFAFSSGVCGLRFIKIRLLSG